MALPADVLHMLTAELSERLDFPTLYNCVASSRQLADAGAVNALYRISHQAPVKGGGEGLALSEQELIVQRWSILWRTITLSAFGKTLFPYCRHVRFLDLGDLASLLDDDKFRGKISKNFFAGELAKFHYMQNTPGKGRAARLDISKIVTAIGNEITQHAPLLEVLSEPSTSNIFSQALLTWIPRLEHLRSLVFWDSKTLADETIRNLMYTHCHSLDSLRIYTSSIADADHHLATFISGMQENSLVNFETIRDCKIGAETCLALNHHRTSLLSLKLGITEEGVQALPLLQGCKAIESLALESLTACPDLKATQNDVYLGVVEWLRDCIALKDVSFTNFVSAPDLLLPVLLNKDAKLEKLQIKAETESALYAVKDHYDFHQALSQQPGLRSLLLFADADPGSRDNNDNLMNAFCSLENLRELRLTRASDGFSDEHIKLLARHLPKLEDLYIGGYYISDAVLVDLIKLANLKSVTFSGLTVFTEAGILGFIDRLGEGNSGLSLIVDQADPDSGLAPESQELIRAAIAGKCNGRFDYQLLRDPDQEYAGESDDSD